MTNYIDLIEALGEEDRTRIKNYINEFGVIDDNFIGLENWLQNWSHSKQRLYKLMGNQFIREFDYCFEKNEQILKDEMHPLLRMPFKESYHQFYWEVLKHMDVPEDAMMGFNKVTDLENFIKDEIKYPIKFKREGARKALQLQVGMKPMRALSKIIEYFKDIYNFVGFEEFRLKHSMILNDKQVKGKICISIHPLDFMTMSDNASNWTSCMSWKEEGCYHIGTVEMMNSNNVVCCYLKNDNDYVFGDTDLHIWNNKRWRQLAYVTKDIIMSGKPYPYVNEEMSKTLIGIIKDLAAENMEWSYSFGPELYQDMKHITYKAAIDRNRDWINFGGAKKHNIIWDTKGMYNDMLNDNRTHYWCYRNKVKKNKLISVSGKAPCLCCGDSVLAEGEYDDDYNERYGNTGSVVCESCMRDFICEDCDRPNPTEKHYIVNIEGCEWHICENCYKRNVRICPDCGQAFYIGAGRRYRSGNGEVAYYVPDRDETRFYSVDPRYEKVDNGEIQHIWVCSDCVNKHENDIETIQMKQRWGGKLHGIRAFKKDFDITKYLYENLEVPETIMTELKGSGKD